MELMQQLPLIKLKSGYESIVSLVNGDINRINELIERYNLLPSAELLAEIFEIYQLMQTYCPGDFVVINQEYQDHILENLYDQLLQEIKKYPSFNIPSLNSIPSDIGPLPHILALMPAKKFNALIKILSEKEQNWVEQLKNLYAQSEEGFQEFQEFLNAHTISFLGGFNSKNFKITPNNGEKPFILKVENRFGNPKKYNNLLTDGVFLPEKFSRQSSFGKDFALNLTINEFCSGTDLEFYAYRYKDKIKTSIPIYIQMIETLLKFQAQHIFFPDMKNNNWLVNKDGELKIADTKSFLKTQGGIASNRFFNSQGYCLIYSDYMVPPEFGDLLDYKNVAVEQMHAYMLGKNIYQYLTNCSDEDLLFFNSDFNFDVFKSESGQKYQQLITKLVNNFSPRVNLQEALQQLKEIKSLHLKLECNDFLKKLEKLEDLVHLPQRKKYLQRQASLIETASLEQLETICDDLSKYYSPYKQCQQIISKIEKLKFGNNDEFMKEFIKSKQEEILKMSPSEQLDVLKELQAYLLQLQNPLIIHLQDCISDLRKRANGWFSVGMRVKANRIESAMARLSLEKRAALSSNLLSIMNSEDLQAVFKEMATHRYIGKQGKLYLNKDGQIDEKKAADCFLNLKRQFEQKTGEPESPKMKN